MREARTIGPWLCGERHIGRSPAKDDRHRHRNRPHAECGTLDDGEIKGLPTKMPGLPLPKDKRLTRIADRLIDAAREVLLPTWKAAV